MPAVQHEKRLAELVGKRPSLVAAWEKARGRPKARALDRLLDTEHDIALLHAYLREYREIERLIESDRLRPPTKFSAVQRSRRGVTRIHLPLPIDIVHMVMASHERRALEQLRRLSMYAAEARSAEEAKAVEKWQQYAQFDIDFVALFRRGLRKLERDSAAGRPIRQNVEQRLPESWGLLQEPVRKVLQKKGHCLYKNYCGPRCPPDDTKPRLNEVDKCCKEHDACYEQRGYFALECEVAMLRCLWSKDIPVWDVPQQAARILVTAVFGASFIIQMTGLFELLFGEGNTTALRPIDSFAADGSLAKLQFYRMLDLEDYEASTPVQNLLPDRGFGIPGSGDYRSMRLFGGNGAAVSEGLRIWVATASAGYYDHVSVSAPFGLFYIPPGVSDTRVPAMQKTRHFEVFRGDGRDLRGELAAYEWTDRPVPWRFDLPAASTTGFTEIGQPAMASPRNQSAWMQIAGRTSSGEVVLLDSRRNANNGSRMWAQAVNLTQEVGDSAFAITQGPFVVGVIFGLNGSGDVIAYAKKNTQANWTAHNVTPSASERVSGAPSTLGARGGSGPHLFGRTAAGGLIHYKLQPGWTFAAEPVDSVTIATDPVAVHAPYWETGVRVYACDPNGHLLEISDASGMWSVKDLTALTGGTALTGKLQVTSNYDGSAVAVVARTTANQIGLYLFRYDAAQSAHAWSSWTEAQTIAQDPEAVIAGGVLHVVVPDPSGYLICLQHDVAGSSTARRHPHEAPVSVTGPQLKISGQPRLLGSHYGIARIIGADTNGKLVEHWAWPGEHWRDRDLGAAGGPTTVRADAVVPVSGSDAMEHVFALTPGGKLTHFYHPFGWPGA